MVRAPAPIAHEHRAPETRSIAAGVVAHVRGPHRRQPLANRARRARDAGNALPDDATIARYWQAVIAANRTTLRSGDPNLIFPGELVTLPPPG